MAKNVSFLQQFEKYVFLKIKALPFGSELLIVILFVLVVAGSLMLSMDSESALNAGANPSSNTAISGLILDASEKGDYGVAEKIYAKQTVLGVSSDKNLEYAVYPDRYVEAITQQFEKLIEKSPYWRDGLNILSDLYLLSNNEDKANSYKETVEWLDPDF